MKLNIYMFQSVTSTNDTAFRFQLLTANPNYELSSGSPSSFNISEREYIDIEPSGTEIRIAANDADGGNSSTINLGLYIEFYGVA